MPSSRTRGAPPPGRQQRLKTTISKLSALAKFSSLQGFADAVYWAQRISCRETAVAYACTVHDDEDVGVYHKLLELFHSAISNALKLLAQSWPQEPLPAATHDPYDCCDQTLLNAAVTVSFLYQALSLCRKLDWYQQEHSGTEVNSALKAGFLQHFSSLSTKLLPALQGTTAQHDARRQSVPCQLVATYLLGLWRFIFQFWPGCKLTNSSLTAALAPAASLALGLMRVVPAEVSPASSNNSSSTSMSKASLHALMQSQKDVWIGTCRASVCLAHCLICEVHHECCLASMSSNVAGSSQSPASAALASADVQRLLLFGLAAAAAVMHRQQAADSTPAASAADRDSDALLPLLHQQHADHGYVQLLLGLGLEAADELMELALKRGGPATEDSLKNPGFHQSMLVVVVHLYNNLFHQQNQDGSNSSTPATCVQTQADVYSLLIQLALPVLHTLKDLTVLMPDGDVKGILRTTWAFASVSRAVMKSSRIAEVSPQKLQQVLQWLLQPLYQKMCNALRTISQQQQTTNHPESAAAGRRLTQTWVFAVQDFFILTESSAQDHLFAAIKQDPVTSLAAVEACVRIECAGTDSKLQLLAHAAFRFLTSVLTVSNVDDAKDMMARPAVQQQLLSLFSCQLKLLMLTNAAPQTTNAGNADVTAFSILFADLQKFESVFNLLMTMDSQLADGQRPQANEVTDAIQYSGLAVVGKAMFASAVSLLNHIPGPQLMVCLGIQVWINHATVLVLLAGDHGKAALAAAQVDELLEQLQESFRTRIIGSTDVEDEEESSRDVLLLMQQCGSAICAALPVKFCCNNPACVNLAKLSEQQLVGKGSRCSGCKVARYCSRECQLKHWKQHKHACKKIQAEVHMVAGGSPG